MRAKSWRPDCPASTEPLSRGQHRLGCEVQPEDIEDHRHPRLRQRIRIAQKLGVLRGRDPKRDLERVGVDQAGQLLVAVHQAARDHVHLRQDAVELGAQHGAVQHPLGLGQGDPATLQRRFRLRHARFGTGKRPAGERQDGLYRRWRRPARRFPRRRALPPPRSRQVTLNDRGHAGRRAALRTLRRPVTSAAPPATTKRAIASASSFSAYAQIVRAAVSCGPIAPRPGRCASSTCRLSPRRHPRMPRPVRSPCPRPARASSSVAARPDFAEGGKLGGFGAEGQRRDPRPRTPARAGGCGVPSLGPAGSARR